MWDDFTASSAMWQAHLETLPLFVLRVLTWLLSGFAVALACGLVGAIAALTGSRTQSQRCAPPARLTTP